MIDMLVIVWTCLTILLRENSSVTCDANDMVGGVKGEIENYGNVG